MSQQEVWRCLRERGVPEKYVRLVKDTYEDARTQVNTSRGRRGMSARLRLNAPWLENCVRQDCDISHSE